METGINQLTCQTPAVPQLTNRGWFQKETYLYWSVVELILLEQPPLKHATPFGFPFKQRNNKCCSFSSDHWGAGFRWKKTRLNLIHYRADSTRTTTVETRPDLLILDSYLYREIHVAVPQVTTGGLAPDTEISD